MIAHSYDYPVPLHQSAGTWWFNLNVELIPGEPAGDGQPERLPSYRYDSVPLPGEPARAAMIAAGIGARYAPEAEIALLHAHQQGRETGWDAYQAYRASVKAAVTAAGYPASGEDPVQRVSYRQACLALHDWHLLSRVADVIAAIPDEATRTLVQIEWDSRSDIDSRHPWVQALAPALGLDQEDLQSLMDLASTK